jgi:two-component sensor histidine kinase
MKQFQIILVILVLADGGLHAQNYEDDNFSLYTKLEGLSANNVTCITQDSTGFIWIGTVKGLNRFDGKSFINYFENSSDFLIPDNFIYSLHMQSDGELLGTTLGGAFTYNPVTGYHQNFIIPDSTIYYWRNCMFDALKDRQGNYILSSKTGLYVFNKSGQLICRYDHHSTQDAGLKEMWFGNWLQVLHNGKIFQQNGLSGSLYDPSTNRIDTFYFLKKQVELHYNSPLKEGDSSSSFKGQHDEFFIVNPYNKSIDLVNLQKGKVLSFTVGERLLNDFNWKSRCFFINDSSIALTAKTGGFYLLTYKGDDKGFYCTGKKYFSSRYCSSIFSDKDGRLWIGTDIGLYEQNLRNPFFPTSDISLQLPSVSTTSIQSILAKNNFIYLGLRNNGGLLVLDKTTKNIRRQINFEKYGVGNGSILFILDYATDTLWLGTDKGMIWLDTKNYSFGKPKIDNPALLWISNERCRTGLVDSHGDVWLSFGRLNSVVRYNRLQHKFMEIKGDLLRITFCFSIKEDISGNIWMAGDGLCRWNRQKQAVDTLIYFQKASNPRLLFFEILATDSLGNIWLYNGNEIIQYNSIQNVVVYRNSENQILDGNFATSSPAINGNIWICLENSISVLNTKDYSLRLFNYADGLPHGMNTTLRNGSFYDKQKNVYYFAAGSYLISLSPDISFLQAQLSPKFLIDFIGNNTQFDVKNNDIIRLPYNKNSLQLRLGAINFIDPEDNRFSYQMMGSPDTSWRDLNAQSSIVFNNLSPGKYEVRAKLFSVTNRWPEQIKKIGIVIKDPFWKNPWTLILVTLFLLSGLIVLYLKRIQTIKQKASIDLQLADLELKGLHAQMNPHFIFNSLNSIKEMILENDSQNASRYLSKFAQLIRTSLEQSKQAFVTVHQCIDHLNQYLEMEKIRFEDFDYSIETAAGMDTRDVQVAPMLLQPLAENAIWHGLQQKPGSKELRIRFYTEPETLVCEVEDNGIGILQAEKNKSLRKSSHRSMGISNIRERLSILKEKYGIKCALQITDRSSISREMHSSGTLAVLKIQL